MKIKTFILISLFLFSSCATAGMQEMKGIFNVYRQDDGVFHILNIQKDEKNNWDIGKSIGDTDVIILDGIISDDGMIVFIFAGDKGKLDRMLILLLYENKGIIVPCDNNMKKIIIQNMKEYNKLKIVDF